MRKFKSLIIKGHQRQLWTTLEVHPNQLKTISLYTIDNKTTILYNNVYSSIYVLHVYIRKSIVYPLVIYRKV